MKPYKIILTALTCTALTACGAADRISQIGKAPEVTQITNPTQEAGYQPVSLPMPSPKNVTRQKNSLWAADRTTFFKDQRAKDIGDIITVLINIEDEASFENESERSRSSSEDSNLSRLLGYESSLSRVLPQAIDTQNADGTSALNPILGQFGSDSNHTGEGTIEREEEVDVRMAAIITQILPNGNMVIRGRQEVVVNFEKRILQIDGVIRPEDITVQNDIGYDKIAEARILYGGEGQITDVQQPRYGQQLYDVIFPF